MSTKPLIFLMLVLVMLAGCTQKNFVLVNPLCPPAHAFAHTNATMTVSMTDWTNITFEQEPAKPVALINHDSVGNLNHTFNITTPGIYHITYFSSFTDASPSPTADIAIRIILNGIEINGSAFESDVTRQDAEVEISNAINARLETGDVLAFQFIAGDPDVALDTHSNFGQHPDSATITMERIACE